MPSPYSVSKPLVSPFWSVPVPETSLLEKASVPPVPGMTVVPTAAPVPGPSVRAIVGRSVWYLLNSGALAGTKQLSPSLPPLR